MATKQKIQNAYIDFILTEGKEPVSVYAFAKKNKVAEEEFYKHYSSFKSIEEGIWTDLFNDTIQEIKAQEIWETYSAREKGLSFFYSFFELLKSKRSFVEYSIKHLKKGLKTPQTFKSGKELFEDLSKAIIEEGLQSGEITERKFISDKYKDALWAQVVFILHFWINDSSTGFEKTDEAIEKGINLTFDLFQKSPLDDLLAYGKFLAQNVRV